MVRRPNQPVNGSEIMFATSPKLELIRLSWNEKFLDMPASARLVSNFTSIGEDWTYAQRSTWPGSQSDFQRDSEKRRCRK